MEVIFVSVNYDESSHFEKGTRTILINNSLAFFQLPLKQAITYIVGKQIIDYNVSLFQGLEMVLYFKSLF